MEVYVISMFDVDCDCPKKSTHEVYAVLTNLEEAETLCDELECDYGDHEYDDRCLEFRVTTRILDAPPEEFYFN